MALATITFWGGSSKSHGVPDTLYTYLISVYVNQVIGERDKIVKITPLTESSPKLKSELPCIIRNSTEEEAIDKAFSNLTGLSIMQGLQNHKSIIQRGREHSNKVKIKAYY
jgi:hypothetical protein